MANGGMNFFIVIHRFSLVKAVMNAQRAKPVLPALTRAQWC
jgi:hypothetical protein